MKIYLLRHGQTDWNLQRRFQGREDIPLNETGILQAEECGKVFSGKSIGAIITSPLSRARRTAEIIGKHVGVEEVIVEEGITERDFSKVSGMTPEERAAYYASGGPDDKEPIEDLRRRMMDKIYKYAKQFFDDNIIMVSHGASINAVLAVLSNETTGTGKILLKNACINIIDYENEQLSLEQFNLSADEFMRL